MLDGSVGGHYSDPGAAPALEHTSTKHQIFSTHSLLEKRLEWPCFVLAAMVEYCGFP